ncbi:MAG: aminotransferase class III-fold pyridoxal phosphate-dependent enzyme [Burkholderiales bacterium]|nr:aminotransferase class III-fold pyridoxal phosphate-dependent enzyme [Burkholderiales bacterium]
MKVLAIVQARMGSTRLPNKVMLPIGDKTLIEILLNRLAKAKTLNQIIVATSTDPKNDSLRKHVEDLGYNCYSGSESDVLDRYYQAAKHFEGEVIVRITGDCPLVDAALVDKAVKLYLDGDIDYLSNTNPPTYPDGLDIEIFSFKALSQAHKKATLSYDKEHVTPYLRNSNHFKTNYFSNSIDLSNLRWTVDEANDLKVIRNVFNTFAPDINFNWEAVHALQLNRPELFMENQNIIRNEGALVGTGQKLWKRAKSVIPGGNMLLSKRAEMFLPDFWPAYYSRSKGCKVWDMDNNEYIDMSIMGIGTNILGYGNDEVDSAVSATVVKGNMSTFNCPEEVYLAEKMVELHPWADMVRFARSGGEANAVAIRIARAASGKDKVAVCGYHGWHDWYLSANLGDDETLAGHLLPGLEPKGVPQNLRGTVFPFNYNNYDELEKLVSNNDIGVIKMEVVRNKGPENNFLHRVRELATKKGIILIFDECTSGFRQCNGGLHKLFGVEPDMAMFGKALGNGYAITATIGRREIMEAAQSTFISSTFWTERIGPTAALKTLEVMEKTKSWETITDIGNYMRDGWQKLADKHDLKIGHFGLPALTGFSFESSNALAYKTYMTQEMLKKGYLASTVFYACTEHTVDIVDTYLEQLDPIFSKIKQFENGLNVNDFLDGPVCHGGFKRLN